MLITENDYAALNRHLARHRRALEGLGLTLRRSSDPQAFAEDRRRLVELDGGTGYLHPSFDPAKSRLADGDIQWLGAYAPAPKQAGLDVVAVSAVRLFPHESIHHLFQSRRIWGDRIAGGAGELDPVVPIDLGWPADARRIVGRLMLGGGMDVAPTWRGRDIGTHLMQTLRALAVRDWVPDVIWGMHTRHKRDNAMVYDRFGYTRSEVSFTAETRPAVGLDGRGPRHPVEVMSWVTLPEYLEYLTVQDSAGMAGIGPGQGAAGRPVHDERLANDHAFVETGQHQAAE